MARRPVRRSVPGRYYLGFGVTALVLGGLTLFLVLVVLPRRYVLSVGLREAGLSFPAEAAPFAPPEEERRAAPPAPPTPPVMIRGPAEIFWDEVRPLLEEGRYRSALPLFEAYLEARPDDLGVRREYAITLTRAGRAAAAVPVFRDLLAREEDPGVRLLLARTLRDLRRMDEAAEEYAALLNRWPDNTDLALEWGRALAWERRYAEATAVLSAALERHPESIGLRVELARVHYWSGELDEADRLLAGLDPESLRQAGAGVLRAEIRAALAPPETPPAPVRPLTTLERAALAQAEGRYEEAALLYQEALRADPGDAAAWRAYADLLQFALEDLEGAREALAELERKGAADPAVRFRLAQLAIWTGRNREAMERLQGLLAELSTGLVAGGGARMGAGRDTARAAPADTAVRPGDTLAAPPPDVAEIRALLGDLYRWEGARVVAGTAYLKALQTDSMNLRARAGLEEVQAEAQREMREIEQPRVGATAYTLEDSDDFGHLDLGLEAVRMDGPWVWVARTGSRWLSGTDLSGLSARDQGWYFDVEAARWWRWGTVRTGLSLGMERLRPGDTDLRLGASAHFSDLNGFLADFRYEHGPAYPLTVTLQSTRAGVTEDRLTANLSRRVGARWSLSLAADGARLSGGWGVRGGVPSPPSEDRAEDGDRATYRVEAGASLGRSLTDELTLGLNGRALAYSGRSPSPDGLRLFWDPRSLLAGGVFGEWTPELTPEWRARVRLNPSLAFIDERRRRGFERVPHFSAEIGLSRLTATFRAALDAFYYQGRFDGYRAYGLRLTLSALDVFGRRGR